MAPSCIAPMSMSFIAKGLGVFLNFKNGKKTKVASAMRIKTLNHASTCPAKYTPIKLNENAQSRVTANK